MTTSHFCVPLFIPFSKAQSSKAEPDLQDDGLTQRDKQFLYVIEASRVVSHEARRTPAEHRGADRLCLASAFKAQPVHFCISDSGRLRHLAFCRAAEQA